MSDDVKLLSFMDECTHILQEYAQSGKDKFLQDQMLQDAIVRRMEVLTDAASHLSTQLQERHPEVPWRAITGFRNVLAHGYHGVVNDLVWQYLQTDVPLLRDVLDRELRSDTRPDL